MEMMNAQNEELASGKKEKPAKRSRSGAAKRRKRWILLGVLVLVIGGIAFACSQMQKQAQKILLSSDTFTLSVEDFENAIGATGTVESANTKYIYSTQSYPVKDLHVEVGDKVQEGDLLCELDSSKLEDQIKQQEVSSGISAQAAKQQAETARDSYNATKEALDQGLNAAIISAESAVQNAYDAWQKAKRTYNNYDAGNLEALLDQAQDAYDAAYTYYITASNSDAGALPALQKAQNALASAQAQYDAADNTQDEYRRAIDSAYNAYVTAQQQLEAAQHSANAQLESSKNALRSSEIGAKTDVAVLTLAQLQQDLEDTRVKADVSGTVTAVYAKVGATGAGLLFVIEDTENLVVDTSVKEYDMKTVRTSMPVSIKSDATGDAVFDGTILSIAPTSNKNAAGETDTMGDVLFKTKVAVTSKNTGLRIGMSVRLSYIVGRQADSIAVPYDAVYQNASGQDCILVATAQPNGKYTLSELPVTQGMENDIDVVITGEGVQTGLLIVSNPTQYLPKMGQELTLVDMSAVNRLMSAAG